MQIKPSMSHRRRKLSVNLAARIALFCGNVDEWLRVAPIPEDIADFLRILFFLGKAEPRVRIISLTEPLSPKPKGVKSSDFESGSLFEGCRLQVRRNGSKLNYLTMMATSNYSSGDILK
jgi:hypothetical protein